MNNTKKLLSFIFTAIFSLSVFINTDDFSYPAYGTLSINSYSDNNISPLSDDIRWRYKIENGKKYKCLYNYTTEQWIGDWILVP